MVGPIWASHLPQSRQLFPRAWHRESKLSRSLYLCIYITVRTPQTFSFALQYQRYIHSFIHYTHYQFGLCHLTFFSHYRPFNITLHSLKLADIHTYTLSTSLDHSFIITKQAFKTFNMSFSRIAAISAFVSAVAAHGVATGIVTDGKYHVGWSQNFLDQSIHPDVVGWGVTYEENWICWP
jgi:hypothetical protein